MHETVALEDDSDITEVFLGESLEETLQCQTSPRIQRAEITVGTRKNDNVTVRVSQPELSVMSVVIHLRAFEYLDFQSLRSPDRFIEFRRLKPKEDAVTIGFASAFPRWGCSCGSQR